MDNDFEKKSIRDNFLERRRLALHIASLNAAGRLVASDMRKGQNEMRKRLQKYRDRQREISEKKDTPPSLTMEDFLERQKRLEKLKTAMNNRPHSSPLIQRMSKLINENDSEKDDDDFDIEGFTDRTRSRIDLRPSTAVTCSSRLTDARHCRRGAKITSGKKDVRYYEEEEIRDRGAFYSHLLGLRKQHEEGRFKSIGDRVDRFCGKKHHEDTETWRPLGDVKKYNKSWVKPVRPSSSKSYTYGNGGGTWDTRSTATAPASKTAWADINSIPEGRASHVQTPCY